MLRATVIDQPAATAIGRELTWEAGLDRVITHREEDIFTADLGGPHDAAFCLPLLSGLDDDQTLVLLKRIRAVLQPGGLVVCLRATTRADSEPSRTTGWERLFRELVSHIDLPSASRFREQLRCSGFGVPRVQVLAAAPELSVYVARAL